MVILLHVLILCDFKLWLCLSSSYLAFWSNGILKILIFGYNFYYQVDFDVLRIFNSLILDFDCSDCIQAASDI